MSAPPALLEALPELLAARPQRRSGALVDQAVATWHALVPVSATRA